RVRFMVFESPSFPGTFAERVAGIGRLARQQPAGSVWHAVEHTEIPSRAALLNRLDAVVRAGGEGLMLRRADAAVEAGRSVHFLKLKPLQDAEAVVIGHVGGQGRHAGRLGALKVRTEDGREFHLGTGLRDEHRDRPPPLGTVVTFTHQGTTAQGIPRFASFLRVRTL
ncbi:MAG: DNA ligase, partial [Rubrivivax sp.]